jgi:hypothetical protein
MGNKKHVPIRDFDGFLEAENETAGHPEKVTDAFLDMTQEEYTKEKARLFLEVFPDEKAVNDFIMRMHIKKGLPTENVKEIVDFIMAMQRETALFYSEFMNDGDISLGQVKKRIMSIIKQGSQNFQTELFPVFTPDKTVELKKEFALNLGGTDVIRKRFPQLLKVKLLDGKTLGQHLDAVENWFNNLRGVDLGNWIKLFGYIKAVQQYQAQSKDIAPLYETSPGIVMFSVKLDKKFYNFFIQPDAKKKDGTPYHSTKAKNRLHKWLLANRTAVSFPGIMTDRRTGKEVVVPEAYNVYNFKEIVDPATQKTSLLFYVNTNILDNVLFKDYVSIKIEEVDFIETAWQAHAAGDSDFTKYRLSSFIDLPLKFLLCLKLIYTQKGNFTNDKNGYQGNIQRISRDNLDKRLGGLTERLQKHIKTNDKGGSLSEIRTLLLTTTFTIAKERGWLMSLPKYEGGNYTFNINPGYFAPQETRQRLALVAPS